MKRRAASVLLLALLGMTPAGADSTRRREVVDLSRLELLRTIGKGWTHSLAPNGQAFAVFDANIVRIYDTYEGKELQTLRGHVGLIHDSAWSRDGRFIATGGYDAAVRIWDVSTGKSILTLYPHAGYACSVAFSADGKLLATGGSEDGMVKLYDTGTGQAVRQAIQTPDLSIYSMAFMPDGRHIVVNHSLANRADTSLRIFRISDGSEVKNVATGPVSAFAVSRDGRMLAYSNARGSIILLETGGWTEAKRLDGHQTGASSIAFHPISRYLASTGRDGAVRIWDSEDGKPVNTLTTKGETDSRLVFGGDGLSLVVSSADATVRVYGRRDTWPRVNGERAPETDPLRFRPSNVERK
jgi:WD40 repeat protein